MTRIEGYGLRTAARCAVTFERRAGAVALVQNGFSASIRELRVRDATRATTVTSGPLSVATVEHLFAALAAAGVREGLAIHVDGPEIPLVDGASRVFLEAIAGLGLPRSSPTLRIARDGVAFGYRFRAGEAVELEVSIDFGDSRLLPRARWDGEEASFRTELAGARTFAFAHEVAALAERGLIAHVPKESAVVIAADQVLSAGPPFAWDEPARHKLLDLVGDLYLWGGPPRGLIAAARPGHAATHAALARALDAGICEFTSV